MLKPKTTSKSRNTVKKPVSKIKAADKPIEVIVVPKSSGWMDKVLDLVKWVDSPFKLATVITLGLVGLGGYITYKQQDLIIGNLTSTQDKIAVLLADEKLSSLGRELLRNLQAETVIVHQVDLPKNVRVTRIAQSLDGRFAPLEGTKGSFFSSSPARNKAAVSMLNGEILCEPFVPSSSIGDWSVSRGVTYTCRGSIPPEVGHMIGYIAVGFKKEPRDIVSVKALINQTAHDMAH